MSYRSNVAIAIYGDKDKMAELKQFFDNELEQLDAENKQYVADIVHASKTGYDIPLFSDELFFLQCECVKWYEEYPVVKLFNKVFNHSPSLSLSGECIILGDEFEDCTHKRLGDNVEDVLGVQRSISVNI